MELIDLVNSVILFLSQTTLLRSLTFLLESHPDCGSHSPAYLDLFFSSDGSICPTMALSLLGNSNHVLVSVSIDTLHQIQNGMPHFIA